jgi:hypothetical protein
LRAVARRLARLRNAGLLSILAIAATAAPAQAGCGGVVASYPRGWHHNYRPPLVIGDSTMIFAVPYIARHGMQANARGCRQWGEGMDILRRRKSARSLPHLVVLALGANWVITRSDIEAAVRLLGPKRVLGVVVPREEGGGTSSDAYNVRRAGRRHRNRVKVLDWPRYSSRHGGWFSGDGLHMSFDGAAAFAKLVATLKPFAPWPKPKPRPKPPSAAPPPPAPPPPGPVPPARY